MLRKIYKITGAAFTMAFTTAIAFAATTTPALASYGAGDKGHGGVASAGQIPDTRAGWEHLWDEIMIDIWAIGIIFGAITIYLLIKYKRKSPDDVGSAPTLKPLAAFGWALIPAFLFLADDMYLAAKNFELWNDYRDVPEGAYVVEAEAYMWGFDINYPEGFTTYNEMVVEKGRPVMVKLTSRDVVHSFFIPDFHNKWDMMPGRVTYLWFYPQEEGEHVFTCAEYCGMMHSSMYGKVRVVDAEAFAAWIKENKPQKGGTI